MEVICGSDGAYALFVCLEDLTMGVECEIRMEYVLRVSATIIL